MGGDNVCKMGVATRITATIMKSGMRNSGLYQESPSPPLKSAAKKTSACPKRRFLQDNKLVCKGQGKEYFNYYTNAVLESPDWSKKTGISQNFVGFSDVEVKMMVSFGKSSVGCIQKRVAAELLRELRLGRSNKITTPNLLGGKSACEIQASETPSTLFNQKSLKDAAQIQKAEIMEPEIKRQKKHDETKVTDSESGVTTFPGSETKQLLRSKKLDLVITRHNHQDQRESNGIQMLHAYQQELLSFRKKIQSPEGTPHSNDQYKMKNIDHGFGALVKKTPDKNVQTSSASDSPLAMDPTDKVPGNLQSNVFRLMPRKFSNESGSVDQMDYGIPLTNSKKGFLPPPDDKTQTILQKEVKGELHPLDDLMRAHRQECLARTSQFVFTGVGTPADPIKIFD